MLQTLLVLSKRRREGSKESNQPEHMFQNFAILAVSAIMTFKLVRRGLMHLKYSELVHKSHAFLVVFSKILFRGDSVKVNQRELMFKNSTLLSMIWFEKV